jgi:group II intron reverse transcriptase/maturase
MRDAEPASDTWTKLTLITERARREPQCQFNNLAHLLNERFLADCYHALGRDRASGVDGVTWKDYGKDRERNLAGLVERMKAKRYKPQPNRRTYIPKDKHAKRPLGIPALEDKTVQRGMAKILEAIYEADFLECSHGFRPKRSCHTALQTVDRLLMTRPMNHIVEADIRQFFDRVAHRKLIRYLQRRIVDRNFLLLIWRFLKAGYMEAGQFHETEEGTPQGGNLSPILSNIFLHYALDEWFEKDLKPNLNGECYLIRYADDFVVLVRYQEDAQRIRQALGERFAGCGLELHPEKTRVLRFGRFEEENAHRSGRRANTFDFLGFTHYCGRSRRGRFIVGRRTSRKRIRNACRAMNAWLRTIRNAQPAREWWGLLRQKLTGHYRYYGISGNMASLRRYHAIAIRLVRKWLNRRSQRRIYYWKRFQRYLTRFPLPRPRIMVPIYTLWPVR